MEIKTRTRTKTEAEKLQELADQVRALDRLRAKAWDEFDELTSAWYNEEFLHDGVVPESDDAPDWSDEGFEKKQLKACLRSAATAEVFLAKAWSDYDDAYQFGAFRGSHMPTVRGLPDRRPLPDEVEFCHRAWWEMSADVENRTSWAFWALDGDVTASDEDNRWNLISGLNDIAKKAYDSVYCM